MKKKSGAAQDRTVPARRVYLDGGRLADRRAVVGKRGQRI